MKFNFQGYKRRWIQFISKRNFVGTQPPDFDINKDYYKILGVKNDWSQTDIKSIYVKIAQEMHPDKNPNADHDKFKEITAAYNLLSNHEKRKQYDEMRKYGFQSRINKNTNPYQRAYSQYSDGFDPFKNEYTQSSNQQGKNYNRSYYYESNSQRSKRAYEEFFRNRYGAGRTGYEEYTKRMKENMNKQYENDSNYYHQYTYNQKNDAFKTDKERRKEFEEYFSRYAYEKDQRSPSAIASFIINLSIIIFIVWIFNRLLQNIQGKSVEDEFKRQLMKDKFTKEIIKMDKRKMETISHSHIFHELSSNQQNQIFPHSNPQVAPRFYNPYADPNFSTTRNSPSGFYPRY